MIQLQQLGKLPDWQAITQDLPAFPGVEESGMKRNRISIASLLSLFLGVGLVADLLPVPGLQPGLVSQGITQLISPLPLIR